MKDEGVDRPDDRKVNRDVRIEPIELEAGTALGVRISNNIAPVIMIRARKGFVMCGYLNLEAAEKLGDTAALVSGVNDFEDVLAARIKGMTTGARDLGVEEGMSGREALERFL